MKPLEGITVVELSTYIAAPGCGRILKTQGARVIKVEAPNGDIERKFGFTLGMPITEEENVNYDFLNGGKEHVVLDLKSPEDHDRLLKLLEHADVFLTNTRPKGLKKLGLDYPTLKEKFPRLIYASILAYGDNEGSRAGFPGFDAIAMFATGGMIQDLMVDEPGAYPVYLPMGFGDLICGTTLSGAIGTALYAREKTGKGDYVSASLHGCAMWMFGIMSNPGQYEGGYSFPRKRYQGGPMGVPYKTKDGKWFLPVVNEYERYWPSFCKCVGAEELIDDPRYNTKKATLNMKNREEAIRILEKKFAEKTLDEVLPAMQAADIICDTLTHFKDNHTDEIALLNGFMAPFEYPSGTKTLPQPPVHFDSLEPPKAERAGVLGADTEAIFKEFGL